MGVKVSRVVQRVPRVNEENTFLFLKFIFQQWAHLIYVIRYNFFKPSIRIVELYKISLVYRENPVNKANETHVLAMCHWTTILSVAILGVNGVLSIIVNEHVFQQLNEAFFPHYLLVEYRICLI